MPSVNLLNVGTGADPAGASGLTDPADCVAKQTGFS